MSEPQSSQSGEFPFKPCAILGEVVLLCPIQNVALDNIRASIGIPTLNHSSIPYCQPATWVLGTSRVLALKAGTVLQGSFVAMQMLVQWYTLSIILIDSSSKC